MFLLPLANIPNNSKILPDQQTSFCFCHNFIYHHHWTHRLRFKYKMAPEQAIAPTIEDIDMLIEQHRLNWQHQVELQTANTSVSKYFPYHISVDPYQDDRASEIRLCSIKRPHMRSFHFAWWSYHVAFFMWQVVMNPLSCSCSLFL